MIYRVPDEKIEKALGPLSAQNDGPATLANPHTEQGLEPLLEFDITVAERMTYGKKYAQISAILVAAASADPEPVPDWEGLQMLRDHLLQAPTEHAAQMLQAMQQNPGSIPEIVGQRLQELRPEVAPAPHVSFDCIDIRLEEAENLQVSPQTMQSLHCAQAVNAAVKSVITDGAPNQAPDVLRTSGRNMLLYGPRIELSDNALSTASDVDGRHLSQYYKAREAQLLEIDDQRKPCYNLQPDEMFRYGDSCTSVLTDCYISAATGTGKCAEHAYASFALLTDPLSLQGMGVDLPDDSFIIVALGRKIDHTYIFIAEPDAVSFSDDGSRRVLVNDPRKVVVVDPWMPVPCAHTLDRSNADIQRDPICRMLAVKDAEGVKILEPSGHVTVLPPPPQPVLEVMQGIRDHRRAQVLQHAQDIQCISANPQANLVMGCGDVLYNSISKGNPRPPLYRSSHMSTHTPHDVYHCEGQPPARFFDSNPAHHAQALQSIQTSNQVDPADILLDQDNVQLLRTDPVARQKCTEMSSFFCNPANAGRVAQKRSPGPMGSQNIILPPPPAPPKAKKTLREDPEMRSTMEHVAQRSSRQRQSIPKQNTSSSSIHSNFNQ